MQKIFEIDIEIIVVYLMVCFKIFFVSLLILRKVALMVSCEFPLFGNA